MKPTDPIEGVLIAQLVVANEAALDLYRRDIQNIFSSPTRPRER